MAETVAPTLLFHDYFAIRGGGERLVLELAGALDAELVYAYRTEQSYGIEDFPARHRDLRMGGVRRVKGAGSLALASAFATQRDYAARSPVRLFSGVVAPFAAPDPSVGGANIFYCHTPPRFLYDQKDFFRARSSLVRRIGLSVAGPLFQRRYERAVSRMQVIVANSRNIQNRIKTYLGRDSTVIYPPVDTAGFHWRPAQGYYLSTSRLTPLKRVGLVVDAFRRMPDLQLVVASGGEEEEMLRQRAADAPNITFTGWVDEQHLRDLVSGAIATIYLPIAEDFGMSPVESMAAGKPVIGVAEGGLLETILDGETGILLPPSLDPDAIVAAVRALTPETAEQWRAACEVRAGAFSRERFFSGMQAIVEAASRAS